MPHTSVCLLVELHERSSHVYMISCSLHEPSADVHARARHDASALASASYNRRMRTTVTLERDVAEAVRHLRRRRGWGISQVINELVRLGLRGKAPRHRF